MNAKSLIRKTRDGEPLSAEEIAFLVDGAVSGHVLDYQLTAWMMAVFCRGLSARETTDLTRAMLDSGDRLSFEGARPVPADKHSTGGVGDKVSFLVAPLVAACGVPVPMISGRSLGHTGGTLDKLESIPGLRTEIGPEDFVRQVREAGLCICGQNPRLAPADRILYGLRDAASIVESVPLITASILSKKAAAGVRALALDVKFGEGAFMAGVEEARILARSLVETAAGLGIRARAHLTRMDRVLGFSAGNAIEIAESVRALRGEAVAADLREITLELGASMLVLAGAGGEADADMSTGTGGGRGADTCGGTGGGTDGGTRVEVGKGLGDGVADRTAAARRRLEAVWSSGSAYRAFVRMVEAQGGDVDVLNDLSRLPRAARVIEVVAPFAGRFDGLRARPVGDWITESGGGRLRTGDRIDPTVGVEALLPAGEWVDAGTPVARLHLPDVAGDLQALRERAAYWIVLDEEGGAERSSRASSSAAITLEIVEILESGDR